MHQQKYVMEGADEAWRLDLKTDPDIVKQQAEWAGLRPKMHVADMGCGPGKTTFALAELVGPSGAAVGVDYSEQRINYARRHYQADNITYVLADVRDPLQDLGRFDFIWMRFLLEHYGRESFHIVGNVASVLRPGGVLCLADLDHNCLSHHGMPTRLEEAMFGVMARLQESADFDPYAGRKLYAHLYDLGFKHIQVQACTHHLMFGANSQTDEFNWKKKTEAAAKHSGYPFEEYEDGYDGFYREFENFFNDPRRFTYTPLIIAAGRKP